ncbi:DNA methyltransferase [Chloroflexota bacterium]
MKKFLVYEKSNKGHFEERIYWLYKPLEEHIIGEELKPEHALLTSIWRFPPEQKNSHPAPFPLALPLRAIYSIMDDRKGLIIDPYCGSGTTLVAAKILGHNYIGIDISEEYINYTKDRLNIAISDKLIANEEIKKHIVTKSFKDRKAKGEFTGRFKPSNDSDAEELRLF